MKEMRGRLPATAVAHCEAPGAASAGAGRPVKIVAATRVRPQERFRLNLGRLRPDVSLINS